MDTASGPMDWHSQRQMDASNYLTAGTPVDIYLSLYFNDGQAIPLPCADLLGVADGQVKFGIQKARLDFTLQDCTLTPYPLEPNHLFEVDFVQPRPSQASTTSVASVHHSMGSNIVKPKASNATKPLLKSHGSHPRPKICSYTWHITPLDKHQGLRGLAANIKLGQFALPEASCQIQATLNMAGPDIILNWNKQMLRSGLTGNKLILIDRALVLKHLGPKLAQQPLSMASWTYK